MSKLGFIATALLTFMLTTIIGAANVQAADCSVLIDKTYNCTEKSDFYGEIGDVWTFFANEDGKLSMQSPVYEVDYRCTCLAKGSLANPKFNQSLSFLCGADGTPGYIGDAITGKVTGNGTKIKGYYFRRDADFLDDSRIFECTEAPPAS